MILARTQKGGGSKYLLEAKHSNGLLTQEWHTKVPAWKLYYELIEEQLVLMGDDEAMRLWNEKRPDRLYDLVPDAIRPNPGPQLGTGKAFGARFSVV